MSRFKNWKKPEFDASGNTKYGWKCLNHNNLSLGYGCDVGAFTLIQAKHSVEIGENVEIGPFCFICSWSTIDNKKGKVIIKDNAKIGSHTTIMPGVTIGEYAVIGAHSFVNKDIPKNCIAYGVPAKVVINNEK